MARVAQEGQRSSLWGHHRQQPLGSDGSSLSMQVSLMQNYVREEKIIYLSTANNFQIQLFLNEFNFNLKKWLILLIFALHIECGIFLMESWSTFCLVPTGKELLPHIRLHRLEIKGQTK